jgi:putative intracellular protease/amidase
MTESDAPRLGIGAAVLFDRFETLDLFGPVEILGCVPGGWDLRFCSREGGVVTSVHGARVATDPAPDSPEELGFILVPGGRGTRSLVEDEEYLSWLAGLAGRSRYVLSVCTGSGLLAAAGVLDGRRATTNKIAFDWPRE